MDTNLGMAHLRVTPLSCFFFFIFLFSFFPFNACSFLFFLYSPTKISLLAFVFGFNCRCFLRGQCSPWRCGVLTTQGADIWIGLGHQPGRGRGSTPWSGVEAPRGASASSRKKTERPQVGLLLLLFKSLVHGVPSVCPQNTTMH